MGLFSWMFKRRSARNAEYDNIKTWKDWLRGRVVTPEAFTAAIAGAMKAALPEYTIKVNQPLDVSIERDGEQLLNVYGNNFFANCPKEFEERVAHVEYLVTTVASQLDAEGSEKEQVKTDEIIPMIKDDRFFSQSDPRLSGGIKKVASMHLAADLHVVFAQDLPTRLRYLFTEDLETLELELNQDLIELTVRNLRERIPEMKVYRDGPLRMVECGGAFEASLLLDPELWDELANDLRGELLAVVPARDLLIVTGSGHPQGLSRLREMIESVNRNEEVAYAVSNTILVRRAGEWRAFE